MMGLAPEPQYQRERAGTAGYSVKIKTERAGTLHPVDLNGVGRTLRGT